MSLVLENNTNYDTKIIRDLAIECLEKESVSDHPYYIVIKKSRTQTGWVGGNAWYRPVITTNKRKLGFRRKIVLKLPIKETTTKEIADTLIHEIWHTNGIKHNSMLGGGCGKGINTDWVENFTVQPIEIVPDNNLKIQNKYALSCKKYNDAEKKVNRYSKMMKKYQKKMNFYEGRYASILKGELNEK